MLSAAFLLLCKASVVVDGVNIMATLPSAPMLLRQWIQLLQAAQAVPADHTEGSYNELIG